MTEKEKTRFESRLIKLALERKMVSMDRYEQCRELVKKSKKIGLESTIEEICLKQGFLTQDQLDELGEIVSLGEDGGDRFAGYRLGTLLGCGGMGKVYEAVHEFTGRKVAIKILNPVSSKDDNAVTRFFQEIRALAKLVHPGIVALYDAGKAGRRYYFTMELVNGMSLAHYIEKNKSVPERAAIAMIKKIAAALSFSHSIGVIHRDIKPENILIDQSGTPKITDFGVVMHRDADHLTLTKEGYMVGSVHFASPEQVNGDRDLDGRSDIYALGATFYYMLTGRMAYSGENAREILTKHLAGVLISPKKIHPGISGKTAGIVKKMMAKNREKRYRSMDELIKAFDRDSRLRTFLRLTAALVTGILLLIFGATIEALYHLSSFLFW